MPPVPEQTLENYPDTPLKQEMLRVGLSIRGLAKKLAGDDADDSRREQERTNVKRWLDPEKGVNAASSARLAPHFGQPPDYFRRAKPRARQADRLEALEARVDRLYAETVRGFEALGHRQHGLGGQEADQEPG